MTQTPQGKDRSKPLDPGTVAPAGPYELLSHRARALGHDAAFMARLRRPGLGLSDAMRLALDAVPALELLPLPVLAQELGAMLNRSRTRVWLA
jgi:hypothetical protein